MQYTYTPTGRLWVCRFIHECEAKRKEILDASIDTADETELPTAQDILDDVNVGVGLYDENEYINSWGITDHFGSQPLALIVGEDIILADE